MSNISRAETSKKNFVAEIGAEMIFSILVLERPLNLACFTFSSG